MSLPTGTRSYSYGQDMALLPTRGNRIWLGILLALILTAPLYMSNYWLGVFNLIGITLIAALGLNVLTGYCGQLSIGHAGFVAVGAYTSAILTNRLGLPFPAGFFAAGFSAGLVGMVFGIPSLRLKGFYLAISTIAAQFIIIWVINHWTGVTGGFDGMTVPYASLGNFIFRSEGSQYYLIMTVVIVVVLLLKNMTRTRLSRAFVAVRDNDLAAQAMGINLFRYKLLAFFIGCFLAGISGSLLAHWIGSLNAEQFTLHQSVLYIGMIIIGGMGTMLGPILGVLFIRFLEQLLTVQVVPSLERAATGLPAGFATGVTPMLFGLVIIIFLIVEPRGLAHRWNVFRSAYRLWPFSH